MTQQTIDYVDVDVDVDVDTTVLMMADTMVEMYCSIDERRTVGWHRLLT